MCVERIFKIYVKLIISKNLKDKVLLIEFLLCLSEYI